MEQLTISELDYLKLAINDLLDLIERTNKSIRRHEQLDPRNEPAIIGFIRSREQYIAQLNELMAEFDLSVNAHAVNA